MNIGILGAGNIAATMATTLQSLKNVTCYAVAAREKKRAQAFADKFGFQVAYGSYADMLSDPTVQAEEVILEAREKGLLLTEAIWTRYMPMRLTIDAIIKSGIIGTPTSLSANLGYPLEHKERMVKLELCGGALLDLCVYPLNFASMVFGNDIVGISAECIKYKTGVDAQETVMLKYADGKMATIYATMLAQSDRRGIINGTNGYIEVENINNPESVKVYNLERRVVQEIVAPMQITGYEYEVISAIDAIMEGRVECPEMPHSETLFMMKLMDSIREAWGIKFPEEVEALQSESKSTDEDETE